MLSSPKHFFLKEIIDHIFSDKIMQQFGLSKSQYVLNTTGPYIVAGELRAGNLKKRGHKNEN